MRRLLPEPWRGMQQSATPKHPGATKRTGSDKARVAGDQRAPTHCLVIGIKCSVKAREHLDLILVKNLHQDCGAIRHMSFASLSPEEVVARAARALAEEGEGLAVFDTHSTPVYATDADGRITYFNRACVDFSGHVPVLGDDFWCVTWKLYTSEGAELPHDQCPLAVAIKEKRPVRGAAAVAERPDGTRVRFTPFPTPLFDDEGQIVGAVNILVELDDPRQAEYFEAQASRCRRLARSVGDQSTCKTLRGMAEDYASQARTLRSLN